MRTPTGSIPSATTALRTGPGLDGLFVVGFAEAALESGGSGDGVRIGQPA